MPFDLSWINLNLVGWVIILVAVLVLVFAFLHFFGHLIHIIISGCGVILLVAALLYILHMLKLL